MSRYSKFTFLLLTGGFLTLGIPSQLTANPTAPNVTHGTVTFSGAGSSNLLINQSTQNAIVDWETFSINLGESTRIIQPGTSSAILNRVTTGAPSAIHGALSANGRVFLINPNGILVGPTGTIDTAGFLASTLDVSDAEFLAGGDLHFSGNSKASVINYGRITSIDGGDLFLIGRQVENHGTLRAEGGTVGLAGGTRVTLKRAGDERILIEPDASGSVTNAGTIAAATAELRAAGGNEYALALNNTGMVRARSVSKRGGKVFLSLGGRGSKLQNTGKIRASKAVHVQSKAPETSVRIAGEIRAQDEATGAGGLIFIDSPTVEVVEGALVDASGTADGGTVQITSEKMTTIAGEVSASGENGSGGRVEVLSQDTVTLDSTAKIVANGANGGSVFMGGGRAGKDPNLTNASTTIIAEGAHIAANAHSAGNGDGGTVIFWSDGVTDFRGVVENRGAGSGAGGFTEVSGLRELGFNGTVDTGGGDLLLDPFNYTIGAAEAAAIVTALGTNNVTIDTSMDVAGFGSSGNATDNGDITVNSAIFYDSQNDLTFHAVGDVNFNASVQNRNDTGGDINVVAGWNGNVGDVNIGDGSQTSGVAAGSRSGTTDIVGRDLNMQAGNGAGANRFSQLGFQVSDGIAQDGTNLGAAPMVTGAINVDVTHDVIVTGGDTAEFAYAQIGHVGADITPGSVDNPIVNSAITISAGNDVKLVGGPLSSAYTQIGHGGTNISPALSGTIRVVSVGDISITNTATFPIIPGHGGGSGSGGSISIGGGYTGVGHGGVVDPIVIGTGGGTPIGGGIITPVFPNPQIGPSGSGGPITTVKVETTTRTDTSPQIPIPFKPDVEQVRIADAINKVPGIPSPPSEGITTSEGFQVDENGEVFHFLSDENRNGLINAIQRPEEKEEKKPE